MDNSSGVGVLDKAALVLAALEAGPATLAGLVAGTGLARPTAHRLAVALEHQDPPGVIFTAFLRAAGVSAQDGSAVAEAARQLGWGVELAPPGMPADTGTAESGKVTTTAYGMAVAAATIGAAR